MNDFFRGKRVLITGHTGFKGSWLAMWLCRMNAAVTGLALEPPTQPSLFETVKLQKMIDHNIINILDSQKVKSLFERSKPEIVFHLAAQPLVLESYREPKLTYETNVIGTVNLLEAVRNSGSVKSAVIITTDKCYENREWEYGYREIDTLGGHDPYSSSKACAELAVSAYRDSFFNAREYKKSHITAVASARAGNVIGGGDWSKDRLIPDIVRGVLKNEEILIRNPSSVRPWQHVLEPLAGYLELSKRLYEEGPAFAGAWNFGPDDDSVRPVEWLANIFCEKWGGKKLCRIISKSQLHEAHYLKLDCSKAKSMLNWYPRWKLETAVEKVIVWTRAYRDNADMLGISLKQIEEYENNFSE
jgi:CDP-glucose 4,6-dehydratase